MRGVLPHRSISFGMVFLFETKQTKRRKGRDASPLETQELVRRG